MKNQYHFYLLFIILFICSADSFGQGKNSRPVKSGVPHWVVTEPLITNNNFTANEISNGYLYLIYDKQINVSEQTYFTHIAMKIVSEAGVENASQISINYNPEFEKLSLHSIKILRNDNVINKLELSKIKVIQREQELSRNIYDGSLSAVLILEDVRKDDIIEYEYSIQGNNPIFDKKFFANINVQSDIPLNRFTYRIFSPKELKLEIKNHNTAIQPEISFIAQHKVYHWQANNLQPLMNNDRTPTWYNGYGNIDVSEFSSWLEVKNWAKKLFDFNTPLSPALKNKIEELKNQPGTTEDHIVMALRFVQDDIRYMGIEIGANSHKPHSPDKVFAQRFGDCKDKSFLLCRILREIGVEAHPVLIHSSAKNELFKWLPMPYAFNHVTVQVKINGLVYWFDPTISYQRGSLGLINFPDYAAGLVVTDESTGLTQIEASPIPGKTVITDTYEFQDSINPLTLKVVTKYIGTDADYSRYNFAIQSRAETEKSYLNFYAGLYPKIELSSPIEIEDNETDNVLTVTENYTIPSFWEVDENDANATKKGFFSPQSINALLKTPNDQRRSMPLGISHPVNYEQIIYIKTPPDWDIKTESDRISDSAVFFSYNFTNLPGNIIQLKYIYRTLKDALPAEQVEAHIKNINAIRNLMGYEIRWPEDMPLTAGTGINWILVFFSLIFLTAIIQFGLKMFYYDPQPKEETVNNLYCEAKPIGGWLILPALGLLLNPFLILYQLYDSAYFSQASWDVITSQSSELYHPLFAPLFVFELFANIFLLSLVLFCGILFFKRRSSLPFFYVTFLASNFTFILLDYLGALQLEAVQPGISASLVSDLTRAGVGAIIWIPVFLIADRVKETFVFKSDGSLIYETEEIENEEEEENNNNNLLWDQNISSPENAVTATETELADSENKLS